QLARDTPSLDLGIHLTLVGEGSVLPRDAIPTLVGGDGLLHRDAGAFAGRYLRRAVSIDEVRLELEAQIAKVLEAGVKATHLDGHQHLHMLPAIRRIVGDLARKYGIRCIRYPRETPRLYMLQEARGTGRLIQLLVLNLFCALAKTSDARRPDHFCGFFYGGRLSKTNPARVIDHLPPAGSCELMCHPGTHDSASPYRDWDYRWQEERDALTDAAVSASLKARNIELVSYADI